METKWIADMTIESKLGSGIEVQCSLRQDDADYERHATIMIQHHGTTYGIQLESLDEMDELIDALSAIRDKAASVPRWQISD